MARKEAALKLCMITQELDPRYFTGNILHDSDFIQGMSSKDANMIGNAISSALWVAGIAVAEWHCIIHDADTQTVWDNTISDYVVEPKLTHFHYVCRFYIGDMPNMGGVTKYGPAMLSTIAAAVGVEPQYIEKAGRGSNAWDNMVSYLTHVKHTDKHQYSPDAVASGGLQLHGKDLWTDYKTIYNQHLSEWMKGRAKVTAKRAAENVDTLEERILTGEITKQQVLLTDEYYEIYARNKRRCDDAFDTYQSRKIAKTIQAMEAGEFKMSVFYITGRSHSGKSYFTDKLVTKIKAAAKSELGQTWTSCDCAASNPLDDYDGSEILVMDDLRGMSMSASDWLKLLDPDRTNRISARYHNKQVACRVVIINSERDILDFFYFLKGSGGGDRAESLDQFLRRILAHIVIYRVPDDPDTRRTLIGAMGETDPYTVDNPGYDRTFPPSYRDVPKLTLHHDYRQSVQDMSYDDALEWLTSLIVARNGAQNQQIQVGDCQKTQEG